MARKKKDHPAAVAAIETAMASLGRKGHWAVRALEIEREREYERTAQARSRAKVNGGDGRRMKVKPVIEALARLTNKRVPAERPKPKRKELTPEQLEQRHARRLAKMREYGMVQRARKREADFLENQKKGLPPPVRRGVNRRKIARAAAVAANVEKRKEMKRRKDWDRIRNHISRFLPFKLPERLQDAFTRPARKAPSRGPSRNDSDVAKVLKAMQPGEVYTFDQVAHWFDRRFLEKGETFNKRVEGRRGKFRCYNRLWAILLAMNQGGAIDFPREPKAAESKVYWLTTEGVALKRMVEDNPGWHFGCASSLRDNVKRNGRPDGWVGFAYLCRRKRDSAPFDAGALRVLGVEGF